MSEEIKQEKTATPETEKKEKKKSKKDAELEALKAELEAKGLGNGSVEDVLSYALFPQVAEKFFKVRDAETMPRNLIVEDLSF